MLHDARRDVARRSAGMRHAFLRFDLGDIRMLHESNRGAVAEFQEAVEGVVDPMHPVQRDQFRADDLGKELDLLLDVLGADREMVNSICQTHDGDLRAAELPKTSSIWTAAFLTAFGRWFRNFAP